MNITIACPASLIDDANHLAMVLGYGPDDGRTYGPASYQDADGNAYAVANGPVSEAFLAVAQSALERPEWDVEPYQVNMAAANRAQSALVFALYDPLASMPAADPAKLTAIGGLPGVAAIEFLGLTPILEPEL
jgi:hypothetical protein